MSKSDIILMICGLSIGLFSFCGGFFNWGFFMRSYKAQHFVNMFGEKVTRVIYCVIGIMCIGFTIAGLVIS